jgi:hypothetical protein
MVQTDPVNAVIISPITISVKCLISIFIRCVGLSEFDAIRAELPLEVCREWTGRTGPISASTECSGLWLIVAEGDHGIDSGSTAGWGPGCQKRQDAKQDRNQ